MSLSFNTFGRTRTADTRSTDSIQAELVSGSESLHSIGTGIRNCAVKMHDLHKGKKIINLTSEETLAVRLSACKEVIDGLEDNHTIREAYCALESKLSEYCKQVEGFASDAINKVREYTVNLFELFMRKIRICKNVDTSKYKKIDSTMEMVVMNYGDYLQFDTVMDRDHAAVVDDVKSLNAVVAQVGKQLEAGHDSKVIIDAVTDALKNLRVTKFLIEDGIVDIPTEVDANGITILKYVNPTERFNALEKSRTLQDAGWDSVVKIQRSKILKNAEIITRDLNSLYKYTVDLMDAVRKLAGQYTQSDPNTCVNLVRYSNILAQLVNAYTKVFDMAWNTAIRVTNACSTEEA